MQDSELRRVWLEKRNIRDRAAQALSVAVGKRNDAETAFALAHERLAQTHTAYMEAHRAQPRNEQLADERFTLCVEAGTDWLRAFAAVGAAMEEHAAVQAEHQIAQEAVSQVWSQLVFFEQITAETLRTFAPFLRQMCGS